MSVRGDRLASVAALERAANRHAVDEVLALFTDDVEFELVGMVRLLGKDDLRGVLEYDTEVRGQIRLLDCTAREDAVVCRLEECNDRVTEAGLDTMPYPSCAFSFTGDLISSWRAAPDPEAARVFGRFWEQVRRWSADAHPADHARIFTPDGRFIRGRGNGRRAVRLARAYRSAPE